MTAGLASLILSRMSLSGATVLSKSNHLVDAGIDDGVVILDLENGVYFGMEGVASRVWALLEDPQSVEAIEGTLLGEYDVDPGVCHDEVMRLISGLLAEGLVEVRE